MVIIKESDTVTLDEYTSIKDSEGLLKRGNHKSVQTHESYIAAYTTKEMITVWNLILLGKHAKYISNFYIALMGIAENKGINPLG